MLYVTSFNLNSMLINLAQKAQIALLLSKKVIILNKYLDFLNVFLEKKALVLPKAINLNQHTIKLQKSQQSLYKLICSQGLVKLETLKTYIKIKFANRFI